MISAGFMRSNRVLRMMLTITERCAGPDLVSGPRFTRKAVRAQGATLLQSHRSGSVHRRGSRHGRMSSPMSLRELRMIRPGGIGHVDPEFGEFPHRNSGWTAKSADFPGTDFTAYGFGFLPEQKPKFCGGEDDG